MQTIRLTLCDEVALCKLRYSRAPRPIECLLKEKGVRFILFYAASATIFRAKKSIGIPALEGRATGVCIDRHHFRDGFTRDARTGGAFALEHRTP